MNAFEKLISDVFNNKDFLEQVKINNIVYNCICSSIQDSVSFTDSGLESEQNFTLDLKLPIRPYPKINDRVYFRDKEYKISDIQVDSANRSIKIHVIAISKGIE